MYAVVRTGGKQYRVQEGRSVRVERLAGEPGETIELTDVLLMGEGDHVTIGAPTIAGARVLGTIAGQGRAKKIIVFRYKSKTRSRKKTGHRQHYTEIRVDDILAAGQQPKPKQAPEAAAPAETEAAPKRGRRKPRSETAAPEAAAAAEGSAGAAAPDAAAADAPPTRPRRIRKKAE
ncbi:MAG: 50S ribosomal protein L21 [Chloroflexota bacterium]|nr:50S ribosomal protein L21 [Chloroflexota bacterium]